MRASTPVSALGRTTYPGTSDLRDAVRVVVPVHSEEIERIGVIRADARQCSANVRGDQARLRELGEGRQQDLALLESRDRALVHFLVDDVIFQSKTLHLTP